MDVIVALVCVAGVSLVTIGSSLEAGQGLGHAGSASSLGFVLGPPPQAWAACNVEPAASVTRGFVTWCV